MTNHPVLQELLEGNQRFASGAPQKCGDTTLARLRIFAEKGQVPKAIVLCCSDSRAPVEMIFDQDIGDLFVIRVAGNIIAPSLVGSVEFAAATFGTSLVVVMGHTQCGAIQATLDHIHNPQPVSSENIHDIVSRIRPHIFPIAQRSDLSANDQLCMATETNVMASVSQLSHASRLIEERVQDGALTVVGALFDLSTGRVSVLS